MVETGDKWHDDIGQNVPLSLDRENVPPGFLRQMRMAMFSRMHDQIGVDDVNNEWAGLAVASPDCAAEAVQRYLGCRFGQKRVRFDPSDPEANKMAVSQGYTVVHGGMMSAAAWQNASVVSHKLLELFSLVFSHSRAGATGLDPLQCLLTAP